MEAQQERYGLESLLWALSTSAFFPVIFSGTAFANASEWPWLLPATEWTVTLHRTRTLLGALLNRDLTNTSAKALTDILLTLVKTIYLLQRKRVRMRSLDDALTDSTEASRLELHNTGDLEVVQSQRRLFHALGLPAPSAVPDATALREMGLAVPEDELEGASLRKMLFLEAVRRLRLLRHQHPSILSAQRMLASHAHLASVEALDAERLQTLFDDLFTEYTARRALLLERFELTLEVFLAAKRSSALTLWCQLTTQRFRETVQPYFHIYDVRAIRTDTEQNRSTLPRSAPGVRAAPIKHLRIGEMPDRGGRVTGATALVAGLSALGTSSNGQKREQTSERSPKKRERAERRRP